MADTSAPVLVYDRIDVNRRNTRLLIATFAVLLLSFAFGLGQVVPFIYGLTRLLLAGLQFRRADLRDLTSTEIVSLTTMALVAFVSAVLASFGNALISSLLLWRAGARRAYRDSEPDLFRTVEKLCIGAGLPPPALYIVESTEPNAFTTGCDPEHASLVINRGLLHLLDERELAAVVAHELSHIGNHDTDFSTILAALIETVRFPLNVVTRIARLISLLGGDVSNRRFDPAVIALAVLVAVLLMLGAGHGDLAEVFGVGWNQRTILVVAAPLYVFIIAPGCATLLRRTMSQERDFLADADATLLTRDPEGLALALAKVGGAIHFSPNADAATAHLYFVDPLPRASWWDAYPPHPPIEARIAVLAKMGDGIPETELRDAAARGEEFQERPPLVEAALQSTTSSRIRRRQAAICEPGTQARLTDSHTLLFKSANHSSVLAELDSNVVVTILNVEPQFIHVRLVDGTAGYIRLFAGLTPLSDGRDDHQDGSDNGVHYRPPALPVPDKSLRLLETQSRTQFRLTDQSTPLYTRPDGWSDIAQQLASGTVVTFNERVGRFACVETDGAVGYISTSAHVDRLDTA
jgi:heat shock protein HtpX